MSQGDNLKGFETVYKTIKFKSILETKIAYFLDCLNIQWQYEPKTFMLNSGIVYRPDFYLPDLKMWIEVKGIIQEHNKKISIEFVENQHTELLLLSSNNSFWFSTLDFPKQTLIDTDIRLGKCRHCKSYFFVSNAGSYHCRKCKSHEGDHDLRSTQKGSYLYETIDFSNLDSIKRGIDDYGINNNKEY